MAMANTATMVVELLVALVGLTAEGRFMLVFSDESDPTVSVTFLYKLTDGAVPRSYGMNVAKVPPPPPSPPPSKIPAQGIGLTNRFPVAVPDALLVASLVALLIGSALLTHWVCLQVAGLPDSLVKRASEKSAELEVRQRRVLGRALCSEICKAADLQSYQRLLQQIKNEFS